MATVLVIDDDADGRDALCRALAKAGHVCRAAANGRDALMAIALAVPDVIVLDVRMPEMNGIEFLHVIRSYLRWSVVPVILLTALAEDDVLLERAHQFGVRKIYLKANYRMADLLDCVAHLAADPSHNCDRRGGIGA